MNNIVFYREMSDDKEVIELEFPNMDMEIAVVKQLKAEIEYSNRYLASLIQFGKVSLGEQEYTIEATIDPIVKVEDLQYCYDNGMAGSFEFV